jgi:hypothetical protein
MFDNGPSQRLTAADAGHPMQVRAFDYLDPGRWWL